MDFLSASRGGLDPEKTTHGFGENDAWIEANRRMVLRKSTHGF